MMASKEKRESAMALPWLVVSTGIVEWSISMDDLDMKE